MAYFIWFNSQVGSMNDGTSQRIQGTLSKYFILIYKEVRYEDTVWGRLAEHFRASFKCNMLWAQVILLLFC